MRVVQWLTPYGVLRLGLGLRDPHCGDLCVDAFLLPYADANCREPFKPLSLAFDVTFLPREPISSVGIQKPVSWLPLKSLYEKRIFRMVRWESWWQNIWLQPFWQWWILKAPDGTILAYSAVRETDNKVEVVDWSGFSPALGLLWQKLSSHYGKPLKTTLLGHQKRLLGICQQWGATTQPRPAVCGFWKNLSGLWSLGSQVYPSLKEWKIDKNFNVRSPDHSVVLSPDQWVTRIFTGEFPLGGLDAKSQVLALGPSFLDWF